MSIDQNYTFKSITLKTSKLSEQYHFYVEKLGFHCISRNSNNFRISCGNTILVFEDWDQNCQYHFAFNIPENKINEACFWVKKYADIVQYEENDIVDFPNWNAHSLYFKDAAGNILELIARHNLKNQGTNEFSPDSILEISEIGIPATDINAMLEKLNAELGFELFWGDMEKFAAIGHEKCLFITVPTDRLWFPANDIKSQIWPLEVEIANGKNIKSLFSIDSEYIFRK